MSNAHADSSTPPQDDSDIFRGEPPPPPRSPSPSRKSSVSTSSSGSILGGRLGAIAAIVEQAISRWAGNESSSSSSSSSSSDSGSGAHSRITRRTRRDKSEHDISTRISRMQAREESRQVPRQFALYLPPSLASPDASSQRQTTSDLRSILGQLDTALKRSTRARRQQERERSPHAEADPAKPRHLHFMLPDAVKTPSRAASFTDLSALGEGQRKGKGREGQATKRLPSMPKAWFLDVSSPTYASHIRCLILSLFIVFKYRWDDMRAIGKVRCFPQELMLQLLTYDDPI